MTETMVISAAEFMKFHRQPCCTYERWTVERARGCYQSDCDRCDVIFEQAEKEGRDILAQFPDHMRVPDLVALYDKEVTT